ncbi:MAG: phosphate-starvation-inducible PsiE family protein [Nitrospirae bacterium]|nr:phosphate-starvation-inducible PsiE family protein [Nitrospirota bacterium]MBI3377826.1 phosphate-starvation-inducible PsiE family protein [Nitrospirota bacterium]
MRLFKKIVDIIIKLMIPLVILALMIGIARIFLDLRVVFKSPTIAAGFDIMITNILSMFIVVELLRSIIEYFEIHRLRITFITDAALVFILREVMVGIYQHKMNAVEIGSLAILLLVIGVVRTLAIVYSPSKTKEVTNHE